MPTEIIARGLKIHLRRWSVSGQGFAPFLQRHDMGLFLWQDESFRRQLILVLVLVSAATLLRAPHLVLLLVRNRQDALAG
jgi:hypothetical protein